MSMRGVWPVPILPAPTMIPAGQHLYPIVTDAPRQRRDLRNFCIERRRGRRCDGDAKSSKRRCEFGDNCPFVIE